MCFRSRPHAICSLPPKAQRLLLLPDQLLRSGEKPGPVGEQQQVRRPGQGSCGWVGCREWGGCGVNPEIPPLLSPGPPTPVRPVLAPQPSTGNSQRLSRPQGAAAKPSSRLPVPSAVPRPGSRMPLTSRSVPASKGAPPSDSLSARKGLPRPSAAGHRGEEEQTQNEKSSKKE